MEARVIPIVAHSQWASNVCARCVKPGSCCDGFRISNDSGALTYWDDERPSNAKHPMFQPVHRVGQWTVEFGPDAGRTYSEWRWRCTALDPAGRCSIYDTRPQLCRDYEPTSDQLCAMAANEPTSEKAA